MPTSSLSVLGLGGVFLYANDPVALKDWYAEHLGLAFTCWGEGTCYGLEFQYTEPDGHKAHTVFSISKAPEPLPSPRRECLLNWRVVDLEVFLAKLEAQGMTAEKREDYEYGRFAWITDPEGNRLELYQPLMEPGTF